MNARSIEQALTGICILVLLGAVLFIIHVLACCKDVESPRAHARAVVLTVAEGVAIGDQACASIARSKSDADLARECAFARDEAKVSLESAEAALDSADSAAAENVPCAVAQALASASRLAGLIERAGGKVPPVLLDGLHLAPQLSRGCNG